MANYLRTLIQAAATASSLSDLALHAAHSSGYVREAAARRCAERGEPDLLPVVTERLNDWVPEIRNAARQALSTLLLAAPRPL